MIYLNKNYYININLQEIAYSNLISTGKTDEDKLRKILKYIYQENKNKYSKTKEFIDFDLAKVCINFMNY